MRSQAHYRAAITYRWYQNGQKVYEVTDWYYHDRQQYWDATSTRSPANWGIQSVPYCKFF